MPSELTCKRFVKAYFRRVLDMKPRFFTDLRGYLLWVCIPVLLIAAAGLWFVQDRHESLYGRERERYRDHWRRAVMKDNPLVGEGARWGAFIWQPRRGVIAYTNLADRVVTQLSHLQRWPLTKSPRAKVHFGEFAGEWIVWRNEGVRGIAACVVEPFRPTPRWTAALEFAFWLFVVFLVCGVLSVGGVVLWRVAEKERSMAKRAKDDDLRKTQFVSDVSHDLKTPLAAIGLWAHHLKSGRLDDTHKQHAYDVILEETARMTRMTENLLNWVRLEQGRRSYCRELVDLAEIAHHAAAVFEGAFNENGLQVMIEGNPNIVADQDAVTQIAVNLVGNAAKYAAGYGPVEIRVREGILEVADRGPGLSPEGLEKCFERFWRSQDESAAAIGGFGLGLAISREMACALGGDLSVSPREGGGLVFTLHFDQEI